MQQTKSPKREYSIWVGNDIIEDYALRYAPQSFRNFTSWTLFHTAIGGISFLALEAIGGSLLVHYGFTNAFWGILVAGIIIFIISAPPAYYTAKYNVDMDLLTRGAGFGYIGSTITSVVYASFTFIYFALEGAIMAQALELYFGMPLYIGYIVCTIVVIPIVIYGVTLIAKFEIWTQAAWVILLIAPYLFIYHKEPDLFSSWLQFVGTEPGSDRFNWILFGTAAGISFSLVSQIGEQVDYLRFMPDKTRKNRFNWWLVVMLAGPGWILLGILKQLGGAFFTAMAVGEGVALEKAYEPIQMYRLGYEYVFSSNEAVLFVAVLFVLISQMKIQVTNAYGGSLAWSNFFSRLTHRHIGRVFYLFFNVAIGLLLMELGAFETINKVLGLYSNVAIAWIGAIFSDLVINKPLGLSPKHIEFKRAHLYNFNPVGFGSMMIGTLVSVFAYLGFMGPMAQAFSAFIALGISVILAPVIALLTGSKYYIARQDVYNQEDDHNTMACTVCEYEYERKDSAHCPFYDGPICSLCCSLDEKCKDICKKE